MAIFLLGVTHFKEDYSINLSKLRDYFDAFFKYKSTQVRDDRLLSDVGQTPFSCTYTYIVII